LIDLIINREEFIMRWKAEIKVNLKKGILDPQGKTIENALNSMGYKQVKDVRVGKDISLYISDENKDLALAKLDDMCKKLLSNPVIEDYVIDIQGEEG
jgi:phosphoribosylformylglycinamidine synthase subunit PurS